MIADVIEKYSKEELDPNYLKLEDGEEFWPRVKLKKKEISLEEYFGILRVMFNPIFLTRCSDDKLFKEYLIKVEKEIKNYVIGIKKGIELLAKGLEEKAKDEIDYYTKRVLNTAKIEMFIPNAYDDCFIDFKYTPILKFPTGGFALKCPYDIDRESLPHEFIFWMDISRVWNRVKGEYNPGKVPFKFKLRKYLD